MNGILNDKEISDWAHELSNSFTTTGKIFDLEIMAIQQFIFQLSNVDHCCEATTKEDILEIQKILDGQEDYQHLVHIKIPLKMPFKISQISKNQKGERILEHVTEYMEKGTLSEEKIAEIKSFCSMPNEMKTIQELLQQHICSLLTNCFYYDMDDNEIIFSLKHALFMQPDEIKSAQTNILFRLLRLLNCYCGNEFCSVSVIFREGIPDVALSV